MTQPVAAGTRFMQEVNASAILATIRAESPLSVAVIAERLGLSRQAVSRSLAGLADEGYVEFAEPARDANRAGRPPQLVRFRAEAGFVVGVDVRRDRVRASVADLHGDEVGAGERSHDGRGLADAVGHVVADALRAASVERGQVWHATVSAPGVVDAETGTVALIPGLPEARGDVLVTAVRAALDCPVSVDNDVKLATQGERWRGRPRGESTFAFVDWGEHIGAGIVVGGELHRGISNDSGDIGYLDLVDRDKPADSDLGPFEQYAGARELLRLASEECGHPVDLRAVSEGLESDEPWAATAVRTIAGRFARGLRILRAVIDPETIVLGGEVAHALGERLLCFIRDDLDASPLSQPVIELSGLGGDAALRGAVHSALVAVAAERFEGVSAS